MFGDQKALDENDPILKTHNMGEGSLDDLPSLFAGKFDFHAITPYSSARILDCILDIYEARIVSMTALKEKHKMKLLRCLSTVRKRQLDIFLSSFYPIYHINSSLVSCLSPALRFTAHDRGQ